MIGWWRLTKWRAGYARRDVDRLIGELAQLLRGPGSGADAAPAVRDLVDRIVKSRFGTTPRGGYAEEEVDGFLDRIIDKLVQGERGTLQMLAGEARFTTVRLRPGHVMADVDSLLASVEQALAERLTRDAGCGHARFVDERVVVIGAGPAGLAAAWAIGQAGVDPLVVEQAGAVAASWRSRHDQLRLNTHRVFSHQPGARIPRRYGPFPARDAYVAYLERYAAGMRIRFGTAAGRIDRAGPGWKLSLGGGSISTAHVVVATGPDAEPVMPAWPGMASFPGTLIHAGQFRSTGEMAGRDVLVVGPGNSGVDLLNHLVRSDAARLWLSARSGMNISPLRLAGIPMHPVAIAGRRLPRRAQDASLRAVQRLAFGDLSRYGYPRSDLGAFTRLRADGVTVAVDDGFVRALKSGRVTMKPGVARVEGRNVCFADGSACAPDVVICATGYRPALWRLVGHLVALDESGMPPFTGPSSSPLHPGLWFFGLDSSIYGNMHVHRRQARQLAGMIARPARALPVKPAAAPHTRPGPPPQQARTNRDHGPR